MATADKPPMRVNHMWAFLAVDDEGNEGIVAARLEGTWFPLIAADEERLEQLRSVARHTAAIVKKQVQLVKFTERVELEIVKPGHEI